MSNHRIYHSLGNNNQMFGCDRELFLINILTCGTFAFLAMDLVITISMVVIGFFNFAKKTCCYITFISGSCAITCITKHKVPGIAALLKFIAN